MQRRDIFTILYFEAISLGYGGLGELGVGALVISLGDISFLSGILLNLYLGDLLPSRERLLGVVVVVAVLFFSLQGAVYLTSMGSRDLASGCQGCDQSLSRDVSEYQEGRYQSSIGVVT